MGSNKEPKIDYLDILKEQFNALQVILQKNNLNLSRNFASKIENYLIFESSIIFCIKLRFFTTFLVFKIKSSNFGWEFQLTT